MRKFILSLFILTIFVLPINAYVYPEHSCYISASVSTFGSVDIYIPCNQTQYLALIGNTPVNTNSSQITGYFEYGNDEYTMRFQAYQYPTVYYNRNYIDITFNNISDTNIKFQDTALIGITQYWYYIVGGFIFIILFVQIWQLFTGRGR